MDIAFGFDNNIKDYKQLARIDGTSKYTVCVTTTFYNLSRFMRTWRRSLIDYSGLHVIATTPSRRDIESILAIQATTFSGQRKPCPLHYIVINNFDREGLK